MPRDIAEKLSRRDILKTTSVGAVGAIGLGIGPGTVSANCPCTCVTLGKLTEEDVESLEEGKTSEFTLTLDGDLRVADAPECQGDKDITVLVTPTEFTNGEVTGVTIEIKDTNDAKNCRDDGLYLCGLKVKGGPKVATYDCDDTHDENQKYSKFPNALAPINENNGKRYGISHITIEVCVFAESP